MSPRLKGSPHIDDERFKSLLERWTDGDFNRADEQELQGLMGSDDFRREAAEGYLHTPEAEHAARLQRMRAQLPQHKDAAPGGMRIFTLPRMMAAAAALALLLIAFRYFSIKPADTSTEGPIAQISQTDYTKADKQTPQSPSMNAKDVPEPFASSPRSGKMNPIPADAATGTADIASTEDKQEASPQKAAGIEQPVVAQSAESESLAKPVPPPAAAPKEYVALQKERANTAPGAPQRSDSAWNDTDKKSTVGAVRKAVRDENELPAYSEPADGWEAFSDYLRQSARLSADARNHNVSGSVRLQFTVGEDGTPHSFVFMRRLGYGCEEEAVRLVKGWEWVRGKNPLTTVEIPFVR